MQLYTTSEAAKRLGLHPETVRKFLRNGTLQGVKIGKSHRIEESELVAYVERLKAATK
jgi:excisionase family DNA binding protein